MTILTAITKTVDAIVANRLTQFFHVTNDTISFNNGKTIFFIDCIKENGEKDILVDGLYGNNFQGAFIEEFFSEMESILPLDHNLR